MSKAYDMRAAIKTAIVAEGLGLGEDDIIIERQADVITMIANQVSLATNGIVLVIGAMRKKNLAPRSAQRPRWQCTIKISLWTLPIYDLANTPEEDITEALENFLSGHQPDPGSPFACKTAFKLTDCYDVPDPDYLVRELVIETILQN